MGKVLSVVSRKARRFNAENRAHRFLNKEKLPPAPKYESNVKDYERVLKEDPNFRQHESQKHTKLDDRLKQVYVTSTDSIPENVSNTESNKPLPLNRQQVQDFEFGFMEPERVQRGRVTLRQALKFIGDHQTEPQIWSVEKISEEYKLQPSNVDNILKYFHTFEVYIPDTKADDKLLVRDTIKKLWNSAPKPLPPPKYNADDHFDRLLKEHTENEKKKQTKS